MYIQYSYLVLYSASGIYDDINVKRQKEYDDEEEQNAIKRKADEKEGENKK